MKVHSGPKNRLPSVLDPETFYFSLYDSTNTTGIGSIAPGWRNDLNNLGFSVSEPVWDFVSIALSVAAADKACLRSLTIDGWTRNIALTVHVARPDLWTGVVQGLENCLRTLTGDFWHLQFLPGGSDAPNALIPLKRDGDSVSLLSGGLDSLVGAIDLSAASKKPVFASQIVSGDSENQRKFAQSVGAETRHFPWNHRIQTVQPAERSTRARSIVFYAYAALASSVIDTTNVPQLDLIVPENGFISLNPPLNGARVGSLSTRTTHPVFLARLQSIWDAVGIPLTLKTPYWNKTKGELMRDCSGPRLLAQLAGSSTSCGRFARYHFKHCGRCLPCLVRRAAFLAAGIEDNTLNGYAFDDLRKVHIVRGPNDMAAVARAVANYRRNGIHRFLGGTLSFADSSIVPEYENLVKRSLEELGRLLDIYDVVSPS